MKIRKWATPSYIVDGFFLYIFNIHYVLWLFVQALLFSLPIITIGPAVIALSGGLRSIAEYRKPAVGDFWREFKASVKPGAAYSAFLILFVISAVCALYVASQETDMAVFGSVSLVALILIGVLMLYYPIAAKNEKRVIRLIKLSAAYAAGNMLDTACIISILVILAVVLSVHDVIFLCFFPTALLYAMNRIVVANNKQLDEEQESTEKTRKGLILLEKD